MVVKSEQVVSTGSLVRVEGTELFSLLPLNGAPLPVLPHAVLRLSQSVPTPTTAGLRVQQDSGPETDPSPAGD